MKNEIHTERIEAMCSLSGFTCAAESPCAEAILRRMIGAQKHRGPDDSGIFCHAPVALGHGRLAVIDPEGSREPIVTPDGRIVLIFNGEIYNFRELRRELAERGHHFQTEGDAECIIHLYEELGAELPARLEGMFAFALWDQSRRTLLLARDRLGQKPLFYFQKENSLVFASELAGLRAHPDFPAELNRQGISDYLSLQYVPGNATVFSHVFRLPPGCTLTLEQETGALSIQRYWKANYAKKTENMSFSAAAAELRRLVEKAVEKRLVSDVPLGTFLSGGVDSCIVTGIAAKLLSPAPCHAFTAGFQAAGYDEREAARESAAIINRETGGNLICHETEISADDFSLIGELFPRFGEPFADASALPFFLLSRFARQSVTVALSGDGADELFAGYERYLAMRYTSAFAFLPVGVRKKFFALPLTLLPPGGERTISGRLRRLFSLFSAPEKTAYFSILDRCPTALKKELFGPALQEALCRDSSCAFSDRAGELSSADFVERYGELDLMTYLPGDILVKADIASMANSLEVRSPFLDREVVEFSARLPLEYKLQGSNRKRILKAAFPQWITPAVAARKKKGFGVPVALWLRSVWKSPAEEKLFHSPLTGENFIRKEALEKLWRAHQQSSADYSYLLWSLLLLAFFLEKR